MMLRKPHWANSQNVSGNSKTTKSMGQLIIIFFVFLSSISFGQNLPNEIKAETFSDYTLVRDSIDKLTNKTNSIIIETCSGFSSFFLTKDSSAWKGYFIVSLAKNGVPIGDIGYTENGVYHVQKSMRTLILKFNADSLYKDLVARKIYSIKQLTQKQLEDKYNEAFKSEDKNLRYGLPSSSHDCNMTISTFGKTAKHISYSNTIVNQKQLQKLSTIKIFYKIRELLEQKVWNYYR